MFIFNLNYIKSLDNVEKILPSHIKYLDKYYQKGIFICSGRKSPRTGGVILCKCKNKEQAKEIMEEDPFYKNNIAEYEVIEFIPSKTSESFTSVMEI